MGSEFPGRRRADNQHSHNLHFHKEWGEKTAPGLVFPRADIFQTPLAALSELSSASLGWVPEHPSLCGKLSLPGRALGLITVAAIRCHKSIRSLLFLGR